VKTLTEATKALACHNASFSNNFNLAPVRESLSTAVVHNVGWSVRDRVYGATGDMAEILMTPVNNAVCAWGTNRMSRR